MSRSFEHLIPIELDFQCENARIMVIDDDPMMTTFVAKVLKAGGFNNVCGINDPLVALEEIPRFQPDLILLDIVMDEMTGLE